jgi:cation transporter-like permease
MRHLHFGDFTVKTRPANLLQLACLLFTLPHTLALAVHWVATVGARGAQGSHGGKQAPEIAHHRNPWDGQI